MGQYQIETEGGHVYRIETEDPAGQGTPLEERISPTGGPENFVTSPHGLIRTGLRQAVQGVRELGTPGSRMQGGSDVIRGAMRVAAPAAIPIAIANPAAAATAIGSGTLASGVTHAGLSLAGAPEGAQNLGSDVAGLAAGGFGASRPNVGRAIGVGVKTAAPGVVGGGAMIGAGEAIAKVPGMEWPARIGLGYPGAKQIGKSLVSGFNSFKDSLAGSKAIPRGEPAPGYSESPTSVEPPGPVSPPQNFGGRSSGPKNPSITPSSPAPDAVSVDTGYKPKPIAGPFPVTRFPENVPSIPIPTKDPLGAGYVPKPTEGPGTINPPPKFSSRTAQPKNPGGAPVGTDIAPEPESTAPLEPGVVYPPQRFGARPKLKPKIPQQAASQDTHVAGVTQADEFGKGPGQVQPPNAAQPIPQQGPQPIIPPSGLTPKGGAISPQGPGTPSATEVIQPHTNPPGEPMLAPEVAAKTGMATPENPPPEAQALFNKYWKRVMPHLGSIPNKESNIIAYVKEAGIPVKELEDLRDGLQADDPKAFTKAIETAKSFAKDIHSWGKDRGRDVPKDYRTFDLQDVNTAIQALKNQLAPIPK